MILSWRTKTSKNAIAHWTNCLGKGTKAQRILTERTICELTVRLG